MWPAAEKTKSGLRTRSTLKGGTSDYNELSFEDKMGQEMLFLQAQKDMSTKVKHDQTLNVGNNRTVTVGNAESITIGEGRTAEISAKDDKLTVKQGDLSIEVSLGKATVTAMQSIELIVGSSKIRIDQNGVSISGNVISVSGGTSVSIGAPTTSISGDETMTIHGGVVEIN
jgi:type VI secretion system secreted protein VgrG